MAAYTGLIILTLLSIIFQLFNPTLSKGSLIELDEDNWHDIMKGEWMVEFFAPWCPACKALQSLWEDYATWSDDLDIHVGQIDVTNSPGLSGRFMITALPSIYHVKDGEFRQYKGSRDKNDFISFIEDKKWKEIDTVPSWKSPGSVQMSLISHFFRLSMLLRNVHTKLTEEYGIPTWGSYLIFALATIVIGAFLGLVLVCLIDFCCPPKPMQDVSSFSKKDDDFLKPDDSNDRKEGGDKPEMEEEEEEVGEEETEGEVGSPDVRKRRARRAD